MDRNVSQFTVTLPSNIITGQGETRERIAHTKTILPHRLLLSDDWEAGLSSLTYTRSWYNVTNAAFFRYKKDMLDLTEEYTTGFVKPGYYKSIDRIIESMKSQIPNEVFTLDYSESENKVELKVMNAPNAVIFFYPELAYALGFEINVQYLTGEYTSDFPCSLNNGVHSLFIYADFIESRIVGNSYAQLLQIAPVRGEYGETVKINFNPTDYIPVRIHDIQSITIDVRSDSGKELYFANGKVIAQLHFRRRGLFH